MSENYRVIASFGDLNLPAPLITALNAVGYERPSPIQAQTIPPLLAGQDLLGNAPTGTGKTAAFALPILARLELKAGHVQALVLTPTRELTIQVAEAFSKYASSLDGFRVLPVYGGQEYGTQLRQLARGVHVVVGTPGRVMDHMRKGTLKLSQLSALVLDEADEMLRMGFIEDVQWILEQTPAQRQTALFSATMPSEIRRIAQRYLKDPQQITIKSKTQTAETIRQRYWSVSGMHKLDALTRILEFESFDGMLIFVRTRIATAELAERLEARGYAASALNGDMQQKQRENTIERLKNGSLDILVATDVAARGLDVDRISHVVNYDIPYDTESYVHRIGRTGRAGRSGDAILFVAPRERRMLSAIERATRKKIERLELPTTEMVNNKRIAKFKQGITDTLAAGDLGFMQGLIEQYQQDHNVDALEIAAALAKQAIGDRSLLIKQPKGKNKKVDKTDWPDKTTGQDKPVRDKEGDGKARHGKPNRPPKPARAQTPSNADLPSPNRDMPTGRPGHADPVPGIKRHAEESKRSASQGSSSPARPGAGRQEMERFRLEVGQRHGAQAGNIVGAIANEAGLESKYINRVEVFDDYTLVSLPTGMPKSIFKGLRKAWVCGQRLNIARLDAVRSDSARSGDDRGRDNGARIDVASKGNTKPKGKNHGKANEPGPDKRKVKPKRKFESA